MRKNQETILWVSSLLFFLAVGASMIKASGNYNAESLSLLTFTGTPTA
jgi:hypothetical protein